MTELEFLSPDLAAPEAVWRSPLARALVDAPDGIADVSRTGKIEIRGDLSELDADGFEVVAITPRRGLVLCDYADLARVRARVGEQYLAIDVTGAFAGIRIDRPDAVRLLRRLTELDLDALPAVGAVAHVPAHVLRDGDTVFRLFFPQEYGDYVAEVVVDAAEGLA